MMRSMRSAWSLPRTRALAAIAPALTMGLKGRLLRSSKVIELKASPEGSTPIFFSTASLPVILKGKAVDDGLGDRLDGKARRGVADFVDEAVGGGEGDAELVRVHCGEFGNVAREGAVGVRQVPLIEGLQVLPDG